MSYPDFSTGGTQNGGGNIANDPQFQEMMSQQRKATLENMQMTSETQIANSKDEAMQKIMGSVQDTYRSIANDWSKRATDVQADAASQIKDANQKLGQASGA